jgi:hypothetical protein
MTVGLTGYRARGIIADAKLVLPLTGTHPERWRDRPCETSATPIPDNPGGRCQFRQTDLLEDEKEVYNYLAALSQQQKGQFFLEDLDDHNIYECGSDSIHF